MKAYLSAKIGKIERAGGGMVILTFSAENGRVATANIDAQKTSLKGEMILRELAAQDIKIGSLLTITVTDEETG